MQAGKQILLVAQKQADVDEPALEDIYRVGTLSTILQLLKLPDGTVKVLVEGGTRAQSAANLRRRASSPPTSLWSRKLDVTRREARCIQALLMSQFENYVKLNEGAAGDPDVADRASTSRGGWPTPWLPTCR